MLKRLRTIFRALFGWMIRSAENPELILRQHMDDLRDTMPKLNAQVRDVVALEEQAKIQTQRLRDQVAALQPKCETAVKLATADPNKKDAAMTLLTSLNSAKAELVAAEEQLVRLAAQTKTVMENRSAYERRLNEKINECKMQIGRAKRAAIEQEMASLTMSFQQGDQTDTLERMTEKIDEQEAKAKAATEVAGTTIEAQLLEVEKASNATQAEDMFSEMQRQLGLVPDTGPAPQRTMNPIPLATTEETTKTQDVVEGTKSTVGN